MCTSIEISSNIEQINTDFFDKFISAKLRNKKNKVGGELTIPIFGKSNSFTVVEATCENKKSITNFTVKDSTKITILPYSNLIQGGTVSEKKQDMKEKGHIFEKLGQNEIKHLTKLIEYYRNSEIDDSLKLRMVGFGGRPKSGKTTIFKRIISSLQGIEYHKIVLTLEKSRLNDSIRKVKDIIQEAIKTLQQRPLTPKDSEQVEEGEGEDQDSTTPMKTDIIILDVEIPQLSNFDNSNSEGGPTPLDFFYDQLSSIRSPFLLVVGYDPSKLRPSLFEYSIKVESMDTELRLEYLQFLIKEYQLIIDEDKLRDLSIRTNSFSFEELNRLIKISSFNAFSQTGDSKNLGYDLVKKTILDIKPVNIDSLLASVSSLSWGDIGGYEDVKDTIKTTIELPLKNPDAFRRRGIQAPKGILLYGPPGCSKTLMAKALASESVCNFISIKGPEIFSKYVGDSEKAIRDVFLKAKANSPCIVFFDEIDSIGGQRSEGTDVSSRVLIQLLTEIDGFEGLDDVIIVGATNRPGMLDSALMRPGRLDELIYIGLPDDEARLSILEIQKKKINFVEDLNVQELVPKTKGYTGAEIVQVCKKAGVLSIQRDVDDEYVRAEDVEKALKMVRQRISSWDIQKYIDFRNKNQKV